MYHSPRKVPNHAAVIVVIPAIIPGDLGTANCTLFCLIQSPLPAQKTRAENLLACQPQLSGYKSVPTRDDCPCSECAKTKVVAIIKPVRFFPTVPNREELLQELELITVWSL